MKITIPLFCLFSTLLINTNALYFFNQGCQQTTTDNYQCQKCDQDFELRNGLCINKNFAHKVKSPHPYVRIYQGEEILEANKKDNVLKNVLNSVKNHPEYSPAIAMVKEKSIVSSRTNYRVICENHNNKLEFYVFYIHKTEEIKIIDVEVTQIAPVVGEDKIKRLLFVRSSSGNRNVQKNNWHSMLKIEKPNDQNSRSQQQSSSDSQVQRIVKQSKIATEKNVKSWSSRDGHQSEENSSKNNKQGNDKLGEQKSKPDFANILSQWLPKEKDQKKEQQQCQSGKRNEPEQNKNNKQSVQKGYRTQQSSKSKRTQQQSSKQNQSLQNKNSQSNSQRSKLDRTKSIIRKNNDHIRVDEIKRERVDSDWERLEQFLTGTDLANLDKNNINPRCLNWIKKQKNFVNMKGSLKKISHKNQSVVEKYKTDCKEVIRMKLLKCLNSYKASEGSQTGQNSTVKQQQPNNQKNRQGEYNQTEKSIETQVPNNQTFKDVTQPAEQLEPVQNSLPEQQTEQQYNQEPHKSSNSSLKNETNITEQLQSPTRLSQTNQTAQNQITLDDITTPSLTNAEEIINESENSLEIINNEIYKTANNMAPELFTEDVRNLIGMFSQVEGQDLLDSVVEVEYHLVGNQVEQYAISCRYSENTTIRFYALRNLITNEHIYLGKTQYAHEWNPNLENNKFFQPLQFQHESEQNYVEFSDIADSFTALNGSHFTPNLLQVARRQYPTGTYFVVKVHIENEINVEVSLLKLNGAQYLKLAYEQTCLSVQSQNELSVNTSKTTQVSKSSLNPVPELQTQPSCCTTLEEKQHACVDFVKNTYINVPYLGEAQIVNSVDQTLPSGVSFDFYLEYNNGDICIGYEATVARYNDGTYAILMFIYG